MGFKSACIIAGDCPYGYLGTLPKHDPARADHVIKRLGYPKPSKRQPDFLEPYPDSGSYIVGAYEHAVFLADQDVIYECFENREHTFFKSALSLYPEGKLLMLVLHSVVNYFGYAYYENGQLVREYAGSAEQGLISEFGQVQPEEQTSFANSEIKNGVRIFRVEVNGVTEECEVDLVGETLVFEIARKFFGQTFDEAMFQSEDENGLNTELFFKDTSVLNRLKSLFRP